MLRTGGVRVSVVDWPNNKTLERLKIVAADLATLTTEKAGADLALRKPEFYNRYAGQEDEFGFKIDTFAFWEIVFRFMYEELFKLKFEGIEHLPSEGRAILVGNHSGLLPLDGAMLTMAGVNEHPNPRRIRFLATDWFFNVPGLREWAEQTGQVRATLDNAKRLIDAEEIVGIYPEGIRGVGKTFRERYRMLDWHPGFVQLAISTQSPVIPVATIGGDEIFPNFANVKTFAQMLKMPFFPLTLTFPWLPAPLPFMPLPIRWLMRVHEPIDLGYPPEKAHDRKLCSRIAKELQYQVQRDLNELLRDRKSAFTGWDED
jgi:1-acyl-sn-glycerol-3-phosphate acyltransferase